MAGCAATVPRFIELPCFGLDKGRIVAIAFIDETKNFANIASPAEWLVETYAATILTHNQVRGSYAPAAPVEIPGYGAQVSRTVGANHEVQVSIPSIKGNDAYWNALNKSDNYKFAFVTGDDYSILHYVNQIVKIFGAEEVAEGLDSEIIWKVSVKWSNINQPATYDVPAGIFTPV